MIRGGAMTQESTCQVWRRLAVAATVLTVLLWCAGAAWGCASASRADGEAVSAGGSNVLVIAATPEPQGAILENVAAPLLEQKGIALEVRMYETYDEANEAVQSGEVDGGYFETTITMEAYNKQHNADLVSVSLIHYEPFGLYSFKYDNLADVPGGARIALPEHRTSLDRALRLLASKGLIELDVGDGALATVKDVSRNPRGFKLATTSADGVASLMRNADMGALNGNYAIGAGFSVKDDALAWEDPKGTVALVYANALVAKEGKAKDPRLQALTEALLSQEAQDYVSTNYRGLVMLNPRAAQAYQRALSDSGAQER
ncbi:hypothetical protein GMI69_06355 [Eggerthellaceae bacterium zg-887]|nr:hypothetical protein [Xiamenia xianingshaonis]